MESNIINYLGKTSYPGIVHEIAQKLATTKSESLQSNQLIQKALVTMNESITPMMDLREFTTNAEILAKHDSTLADILKFITKNIKSGDLNFLINMAKEEHFKELSRTGFPNVESTIKSIEQEFNEPSSVIEQGIKAGLFDNLKSKLLMDLKSSLVEDGTNKIITNPNEEVRLNENQVLFNNTDTLMSYNPIAIKMEDVKNNRILLLTESDVLSFDRNNKSFSRVDSDEVLTMNIPDNHKRMMSAIQELTYNPIDNSFELSENWDFNINIDSNGNPILIKDEKSIPIKKEDISTFLMESLQTYLSNGKNINKNAFLRDADNMILMVENNSQLIKIDELSVIKNINESSKYVILEPNSLSKPKLIAGKGLKKSLEFDSYVDLNESCNQILDVKITGLFENQLNIEKEFNKNKFDSINLLMENQNEINKSIVEVENLLKISEENSPAFQKLNESRKTLLEDLDKNLNDLNYHTNIAKLYQ